MTTRERLKALMRECWFDTRELLQPAGWRERVEARATLAAALFRERCLLEFGPERLADLPGRQAAHTGHFNPAGYSSLLTWDLLHPAGWEEET